MNKFTITTGEIITTPADEDGDGGSARASLTTQSPIPEVGESIARAVLGSNPGRVALLHIVTTATESTFVAESLRSNPGADIPVIAERLGNLLNNPGLAAAMMVEQPFYTPYSSQISSRI